MESSLSTEEKPTKHFLSSDNPLRPLVIIIVLAVVLGAVTGYVLSNKKSSSISSNGTSEKTKQASQDSQTFRDFAEGVIKLKPVSKDSYGEGTHILEREGAVSVALTSSVIDLSGYEGKKVKVFGETQKALKEGWLMDVGKIEEIK